MTTDLVVPMTEPEARRVTERIRLALDRVADSWADLADRIAEAYQRRADLALGYESWSAYASAEFGQATNSIAAEVRRELVGLLSAQGMSTRAIAPAVGAGVMTVSDDRKALRESGVRTPYTSPAERIDRRTGEVESLDDYRVRRDAEERSDAAEVEEVASMLRLGQELGRIPRPVTGLDGKTYTRPDPKPAAPRRRAWTEAADEAGAKLDALVVTIKNLARDERFEKYKGEAPRFRKSLAEAIDALQRVHDQITTEGI